MKTERLPDIPKQEPGDFYYQHLRLPYGNASPAKELPFEPDSGIEDLMDLCDDSGDQVGFVILRKDNQLEIVDALTGDHVRIIFGAVEDSLSVSARTNVNLIQRQQLVDALMQVALLESKTLSVSIAEIVAYLQKREHLAALGTFQSFENQFRFLGVVLEAAGKLT